MLMVVKETPVFTRQVDKLLDVESYRLLQLPLVQSERDDLTADQKKALAALVKGEFK